MVTVLVTGVGGVGGAATVRALLKHTSHELVGVDMDPLAPGLYMVERGRTVPPADADNWVSEMSTAISDFDVDVVIPLVDEELTRLPTLYERVDDEVEFVVPRPEVVETCIDKYALTEKLKSDGLSVPNTVLANEVIDESPVEFPAIAKPRRGRGSESVERLNGMDDLRAFLSATDYQPADVVVQEYIEGTEYTTSVVVTRQNDHLSTVPKRVIDKPANTRHGVTELEPRVVQSCRRVFETLTPYGPINVQQIRDDDTGRVYTIEVNPRFSSTACLTVAAGVNELDLLVRDAAGESVSGPFEFTEGIHILRYTDELFVHEDQLGVSPESDPIQDQTDRPPVE